MIIGELDIKPTKTTLTHGDKVFGTVKRMGYGGYRSGWQLYIPSRSFTAFEKSREIAENFLINAYVQEPSL